MAAPKLRWGDTLDEEDVLPAGSTTVDARGVKTIISYTRNSKGETVKTTTKLRVSKIQQKTYKAAQERRKWKKFGHATKDTPADNMTVRSNEEIPFERIRPVKQTAEEKRIFNISDALNQGMDNKSVSTNLKELLEEKKLARKRAEYAGEKPPEEDAAPSTGLPPPGSKAGGYIAPHLRGKGAGGVGEGMDMQKRREENSVRVTNLSEDTREEDLRELFTPFGPISRIYIAYDRDTGENRGFAFVNFSYKVDAQKAIDTLDGYGYDNLILHLEWAQPRAER